MMSVKFEMSPTWKRDLNEMVQDALRDVAADYQKMFDRLGLQYKGRPIPEIKAALRHELSQLGGTISDVELTDYATWIRERPRLARPGTTIWSTVQTQPAWALEQQWLAGGQTKSLPPLLSAEQIRLMAYIAIAAGSRGLLFESRNSLDATDPETRTRAAALELLNLELELIRPWAAAGSLVDTIESNVAEVSGAVFCYKLTRLLVPLWTGRGAQFTPGQSATQSLSFVVPGAAVEPVVGAVEGEMARELARRDVDRVWLLDDVTIVTAVGAGMRATPGVAHRIFGALARAGINVVAIAQGSECSLSLLLAAADAREAVRRIHEEVIEL